MLRRNIGWSGQNGCKRKEIVYAGRCGVNVRAEILRLMGKIWLSMWSDCRHVLAMARQLLVMARQHVHMSACRISDPLWLFDLDILCKDQRAACSRPVTDRFLLICATK